MPSEIHDAFEASAKCVEKLLCEPGQCLYVPAYQRQFSWDNTKIDRLIQDLCHGWRGLMDADRTFTFLGSVIVAKDISRDQFKKPHNHLPGTVLAIVDGQQRITTLILVLIALHTSVSAALFSVKQSSVGNDTWLIDEAMKLLDVLLSAVEFPRSIGDEPYKFFPRVIRIDNDVWSPYSTTAKYESPIARLVNEYSAHTRGKDRDIKFLPANIALESHQTMRNAYTHICKRLKSISSGDTDPDFDVPLMEELANASSLHASLTGEWPEEIKTRVKNEQDNGDYAALLKYVLFACYITKRAGVTLVIADDEDYAFDIFESLNTTGEPLTAYETFVPRAIRHVTQASWDGSTIQKTLGTVESYLETFSLGKKRQDATAALLSSFALAESAKKLGLKLPGQRNYMKDTFDDARNTNEAEAFVDNLANSASFYRHCWPSKSEDLPMIDLKDPELNDTAKLCLDFLRRANHEIVTGLLARFYLALSKANPEQRNAAAAEFVDALKAVSAFWVFWRLSRPTTSQIDSHYRKLMLVEGFARKPHGQNAVTPTATKLREYLQELLAAKRNSVKIAVSKKSEWVAAVQDTPVYTQERTATRFLLLAAMHDSVADTSKEGLLQAGTKNTFKLLTHDQWRNEELLTIEHVAPGQPEAGHQWDLRLYQKPGIVDRLGNLTLLPQGANTALGNEEWHVKKVVYQLLAAETNAERNKINRRAIKSGVVLPPATEKYVVQHSHLKQCSALAPIAGEWDFDLITERSKNLAELGWDRLAPWLGL